MIDHIDIANVLFLDIECVSGSPEFPELPEALQDLWRIKSRSVLRKTDDELTDDEVADFLAAKGFATQVYVRGTFGATRVEEGKVLQIKCAE